MQRRMMQPMTRRWPKLARGLAACALFALPTTPMAPDAAARPTKAPASSVEQPQLAYTVAFDGVGAEGIDDIWRGPLGGATRGEITLRVEYRGGPMEVARPAWPVRVLTFVAADDPTRSLLAETSGTLDWDSGIMQLAGLVTEGWMKGARVEQTLRLDRTRFDGVGSMRVALAIANR